MGVGGCCPETSDRPAVAEKLFFLDEIHEEVLWLHSVHLKSRINEMKVKA